MLSNLTRRTLLLTKFDDLCKMLRLLLAGLFGLIGVIIAIESMVIASVPFFVLSGVLLVWGALMKMVWIALFGLFFMAFFYFGVFDFILEVIEVLNS